MYAGFTIICPLRFQFYHGWLDGSRTQIQLWKMPVSWPSTGVHPCAYELKPFPFSFPFKDKVGLHEHIFSSRWERWKDIVASRIQVQLEKVSSSLMGITRPSMKWLLNLEWPSAMRNGIAFPAAGKLVQNWNLYSGWLLHGLSLCQLVICIRLVPFLTLIHCRRDQLSIEATPFSNYVQWPTCIIGIVAALFCWPSIFSPLNQGSILYLSFDWYLAQVLYTEKLVHCLIWFGPFKHHYVMNTVNNSLGKTSMYTSIPYGSLLMQGHLISRWVHVDIIQLLSMLQTPIISQLWPPLWH